MVMDSPESMPRTPPLGEPGVPATAEYAREQSVDAGIGDPTVMPEQVIAPRVRLALLPPEAVTDTTWVPGPGTVSYTHLTLPTNREV